MKLLLLLLNRQLEERQRVAYKHQKCERRVLASIFFFYIIDVQNVSSK